MARLRALLIDLSGTIEISGKPITDGTAAAIQRLRKAGILIRWVSNTSKQSSSSLLESLHQSNLDVRESELFTSLSAVRQYVDSQSLEPFYLLSPSAITDFCPRPSTTDEDLAKLDSVVVGLAPLSFEYNILNTAFRLLSNEYTPTSTSSTSTLRVEESENSSGPERRNKNKKMRLIATHKALYIRDKNGKLSLGPGGFVEALESSTGVKAEVVGKPEKSFFEAALVSLEKDGIGREDWSSVGMVGDDYRQDTGLAVQELNLTRFLVKTGKYRDGDESKLRLDAKKEQRGLEIKDPEWCEGGFEEVVDWVLSNQ